MTIDSKFFTAEDITKTQIDIPFLKSVLKAVFLCRIND
jgi:hypothetical protein